jgi:hypothetical protein
MLPAIGCAWHAEMASLQTPVLHASVKAEQFAGAPPWQIPAWQVSPTLQKRESLHGEPLGSSRKQLSFASSQLSPQSLSLSGPGQGLPVCVVHTPPPAHLSVPLQKSPSLHAALTARAVHVPAVAGLTLQDMQSVAPPAHALVQHTESTHVSALHIAVRRQLPPTPSFVWQRCVVTVSQY